MKGVFVFAAIAITLGAACDTTDVLDAYAQARQDVDNCDILINTLSSFFFTGETLTDAVASTVCTDECSMVFLWDLHQRDCAGQETIRATFDQIVDSCACDLDAFFLSRGGRCISQCQSGICVGNQGGSHFDEPFISTEDGHKMVMHVMGATLTLESGSSTGADERASRDGGSVGHCEGSYVSWDSGSSRCLPQDGAMSVGTRMHPFSRLASKQDLTRLEERIRNTLLAIENRINTTSAGLVDVASVVVASNSQQLQGMRDVITQINDGVELQVGEASQRVSDSVTELENNLRSDFEELTNDIATNVLSQLEELSEIPDNVNALMGAFENTAFLDHSKPVYRWGVWSSYNQWQGWYGHGHHGDENMFGGVDPQRWGDGNALVWEMSGNKDILRGLFNKRGYMGWQGTMWNQEWFSHSSTNSRHSGALFRIKSSNSGATNWRVNFYYSSYNGWSERASATVNGHGTWQSGGSYCGSHCDANVNFNIPGNRISTVIIASASSPRSSGCCDFGPRGNFLAFRDNTLRLPSGLEYIDDMDYAQGGWDR